MTFVINVGTLFDYFFEDINDIDKHQEKLEKISELLRMMKYSLIHTPYP